MTAAAGMYRTLAMARRQPLTRALLRKRLLLILGDARLLWIAKASDTTTSTSDDANARTITWDATVASRLSRLGRGTAQAFDGAANYGTTPDAANLSFGNGTTDSAFSVVALMNLTGGTGTTRNVVTKRTTSNREWQWRINATTETSQLMLFDESAASTGFRATDAGLATGAWVLGGWTYTAATGGATAANDMTGYVNGASVASTATNSGTYVAMENLAAATEIGSADAHTAGFLNGSLAFVAVTAKALSASDHAAIYALCRKYYGAP